MLADILREAPGVKLLVTTRERLNLRGEWILEVAGMRFPEDGDGEPEPAEGYSAVQLFLQRASQVDAAFSPAAEEVQDIVSSDLEDVDGSLLLFVDFERMGVDQKVKFIVEIVGEIKVVDGSGSELATQSFHVTEKGTWTLSAAKNAAIEEFVREIEAVLNSV